MNRLSVISIGFISYVIIWFYEDNLLFFSAVIHKQLSLFGLVCFRNLIDTSRRRVLVFKNGNGSGGAEIVANPNRFEDVCIFIENKVNI